MEGKERQLYEKKRKIKQALEEGKPIPTELRNEEAALRQEIDLEDEKTQAPISTIDDEYRNANERDPKILITTSHNPHAPLKQFVKELSLVFPNSQRMNRGGQVLSEIVESCRAHDFTDLILVHEKRDVPKSLIICHLPFGPTTIFEIVNVVTRHDNKDKEMGTVSQAYPHLILNNLSTKTGERTATILKHLFPVPKPDSKRIITFANQSDYISFRHHVYKQSGGGPKSIELKELGPRFELKFYKTSRGTVDQVLQNEAQTESVLRPFMNTSKKQKVLGE